MKDELNNCYERAKLLLYCGGVQWHPLNYHLTQAVIVPLRGLSTGLRL